MGCPVCDLFFTGGVRIETLWVGDFDETITRQYTKRWAQPGWMPQRPGEGGKRGPRALLEGVQNDLSSSLAGASSKVGQHQRAEDAEG